MFANARPHRFPPLSEVRAPGAGRDAAGAASLQAALSEGFQQGMDKGYQEGLRSGQAEGHAQGLQEGRRQGQQQALAESRQEAQAVLNALASPLESILAALKQQRSHYQAAQRKEVVELVAKVARQVIRCELALQPVQMLALVDETLATLPPAHDDEIEVFLNPEELARIRELDPARAARWPLRADPLLGPGECRVRAGQREVDAGCQQRLAACMGQIEQQLGSEDDADDSALPGGDSLGADA